MIRFTRITARVSIKSRTTSLIKYRYSSTAKDELAPQESQRHTLPDGRVLGFAEYGDPKGNTLFYFHGAPSSRLSIRWAHRLALERRIHLIAPDRPGYGLSTFQPNRRIVDWPADVQSLAHHLGLQQYAVLGMSGGGPHALACARVIPEKVLTQVGMVASVVPWYAFGLSFIGQENA